MYTTEPFIEEFLNELVPEKDNYLKEMRRFAEEEEVPIIDRQVENYLAFFLSVLKPRTILELGTAIGYSASVMARATNAVITTVELDSVRAINARTHLQNQHLEDRVDLIVGDAAEFITKDRGSYDFIFIDAAKGQYEVYLKECLRLLNEDGVICMDNVLFHGMLASKALFKRRKITIVKRLKRMLHTVFQSDELSVNLLPVGDGVLMIRRLNE
ncbi:O-methyltransferase [Aedoeadaptatus coxii]|uniref:tRNA 5-hydroxyuridine methyltransferase n=1 Tax=Aedoeadaptatus coxii TaxID=755172 RepID=A0A134AG04_9FIRM|nr:O-methyltransferase [Peptoniphilus coxii]KXB66604.1 O-methyltransferase [Peptoniphilus coxii]